jgi:hypothetical protein
MTVPKAALDGASEVIADLTRQLAERDEELTALRFSNDRLRKACERASSSLGHLVVDQVVSVANGVAVTSAWPTLSIMEMKRGLDAALTPAAPEPRKETP